MSKTGVTLSAIEEDLRSETCHVRTAAWQELLRQVRANPQIHQPALSIFRGYLQTEHHPASAIVAARGVEHIVGPVQARAAWLALLNASREDLVAGVTLTLIDPFYVPTLLDLLQRRGEPQIRGCVIRTLGRMRDPAVLNVLIDALATPQRLAAIEALGDLGDARAIPHLQPLLSDETETGEFDERGAILRVNHVAHGAIRRIQSPPPGEPRPIVQEVLPYEIAARSRATRFRWMSLLPLAAAVIEVPWVIAVLVTQYVRTGQIAKDEHQVHQLDLMALLPAALGLFAGIFILLREDRPRRLKERILLLAGCLSCAIFVFWFGWELTH